MTGSPAGSATTARRIWSGSTSLDVVEIDAASNRGVDDARDLRERAMYAPSDEHRHKVYIVDEAHMLTREAWNALLKVLEEPPPRVHFIFATTEPQKIEQTAAPILSRCQRFDFRRVGVADITTRVREVLAREGVEASDEALRLVARKADGGMRDALSLTDQVLALSEGGVDAETVRRILGVVGDDHYLHLFDLLAAGTGPGSSTWSTPSWTRDSTSWSSTTAWWRPSGPSSGSGWGGEDPDVSAERLDDWRERAERFDAADLLRMLGMAAELEVNGSLRRTQQPRVLLELLLLRFVWLDRTVELEAMIRALGGEGPLPRVEPPAVPPPAPPPGPPPATPRSTPAPDRPRAAPPAPADSVGAAAPSASTERGPAARSPLEAWKLLLERGSGIPPGLSPFLHGAPVREHEGGLEVRLPPGPALERLREPATLAEFAGALGTLAGGPVPLAFVEGGEPETSGGGRISSEVVRKGRLDDLLAREPGLGEAVEALDLELMD
jgi:DNA polymerase III subunit gamma/tau